MIASDSVLSNPNDIAGQLLQLRLDIEEEMPFTGILSCFLYDICRRLRLTDSQIANVVGQPALRFIEGPLSFEDIEHGQK